MIDAPPRHAAESALRDALARVHALHASRDADPALAAALARLADWQSRRLGATYADLGANPRYEAAVAFFRDDLYGPGDFTRRDEDLGRIVPLLVRMLPERVVATVAEAMELNALSQELDRRLLAELPCGGAFSVADYCGAYRRAGSRVERERQIRLIVDIGEALDVHVGKSWVRAGLAMMRGPAHLAGFGVMHDFLERGFDAFRRMGGAREFLATIRARETALMEAILAGRDDPFDAPPPAAPSR